MSLKIKMLCTLANDGEIRLAPINDAANTVSTRGIDLLKSKDALPALKQNDVYVVEITATPQA